jgi:hypothetical protein
MMLEALAGAALRSLLLALLVGLGLRILRVRHPQLLLTTWTAVLVAALAMPILQRYALVTVPLPPVDVPISFADLSGSDAPATPMVDVATPVVALPARDGSMWRVWLTSGYLIVAAVMLARLLVGLVLSWILLRRRGPFGTAGPRAFAQARRSLRR